MTSSLERAIRQRAREFDLAALLALLRERFPDRSLRYRSRESLALRPALIDAVDFEGDRIVVTLNLGLRSSSGPLPSYFLELLAKEDVGPGLGRLIEWLDHHLLRDRIEALCPEQAPRLLRDTARFREDLRSLSAPPSLASAHGVVAALFPELEVLVRRTPITRRMPVDAPRLGAAMLGAAALGGEAEVPAPGLDVVLRTTESTTWNGVPWTVEAKDRLADRLFPLLEGWGAFLRVFLVDLEGRSRLALQRTTGLGGAPLGEARPPQIVLLFEGSPDDLGTRS